MYIMPYVGTVDKDTAEAVPLYYARTLLEPIHNTRRNVTCDDWFTSIPICDKLRKEYGLTLVGTVRKK